MQKLCSLQDVCVICIHLSAKAKNISFQWRGGDWTTKYAPWARGAGVDGPRGSAFNLILEDSETFGLNAEDAFIQAPPFPLTS